MGDMLFDDFDVDALLDAQSSDDDGSDLPELERSVDDILNDTEFADILGDSLSVKSFSTTPQIDPCKSSSLITNGHAAIGLEGETIQNSRSGLKYRNGEIARKADKLSFTGCGEDGWREECTSEVDVHVNAGWGNSEITAPTTEILHVSSAGIPATSQSDRFQATSTEEGAHITGTRRIVAVSSDFWEANGRTLTGAQSSVNVISQSTKFKSSPRPGAAFAAAAAASRLFGSSHSSGPSRTATGSDGLQKGPSTGSPEYDRSHLGVGGPFRDEDFHSPAQFQDDLQNPQEAIVCRTFELEVPDQNLRSLGSNDGLQGAPNEQSLSNGNNETRWSNDEVYDVATADLNEKVEILSALVSQLNEQKSYSSSYDDAEPLPGVEGESLAAPSSPAIAPSGSSAIVLNSNRGSTANEMALNLEVMANTMTDNLCESAPQADQTEPELSDVVSLNNWIEESQEHVIASSEASTMNCQLNKSQSLTLRKTSISANETQQAGDEVDDQQKVAVERSTGLPLIEESPQLTALQIAEELERNAASSGLHWEEGAVAQPMRLEGIQRGAPAIGLLQLDSGGSLSYALQSSALRRDHGSPQALAVQSNFIAIGLSKGAILVIPSKYSATRSADETDAKPFVLATPGPDKSVSSMCFSQQGDLLLVGYSNGHLVLWDVPKANVIKTLEKEHSVAIVHTLFLGQDVPGARNFKTITSDSKGLTLLHTFTVLPVPVLRRYTVNTTCILDGQRTGIVLSVSPLLPEEGPPLTGASGTVLHGGSSVPMNLSSVMGVVGGGGGDIGRKFLYDGAPSSEESVDGLVVFVTHQVALVVRLLPTVEVCARVGRPEGIRDGAIPYTAWKRTKSRSGVSTGNIGSVAPSNLLGLESGPLSTARDTDGRSLEYTSSQEDGALEGPSVKVNGDENCPSLALAWDRKVFIYQLPKSELKSVAQWEVDSPAVGVAWLEEQMMVVATSKDQLCLFTNEGVEIERATLVGEHGGIGAFIYHTHFMNLYGNPEKAYHNALAVRGAALYLLGSNRLWRARLLPWRDRIKALENAGDWMGAFHIAMEIYDGRSQGVTGLPRGLAAMREAIMPTLLALLSAYIDEAFAYLSLARGPSSSPQMMRISTELLNNRDNKDQKQELAVSELVGVETSLQEMVVEAREQYARVGGVAIEFCVHIQKIEVLFENVFSKFEAVGQRGTFLELLEPYILKDMLGGLAPEVMQALVEHYSSRGWLNRVEQCVLHMDIGSLDFNQVVRVCRDHRLYSALIYLFTKGLDDFKSPLEELLVVSQNASHPSEGRAFGYKLLVYLKYCFTGLAFPPGNGTLPSSRLPNLRAELLGYLLDPMETRESPADLKTDVHKLYPRLLYLLELDTQATLLVLGAAFPEDGPLGLGKRNWLYPLLSIKLEKVGESNRLGSRTQGCASPAGEWMIEGLKLAQKTIDALVCLLQTFCRACRSGDTEQMSIYSQRQWPNERDTGDMLEFVAHFAAENYAAVPSPIISNILEHLTSSSVKDSTNLELPENKKVPILKQREDLMVVLLQVVHRSQWDADQTLQLAQKAGYWQVTALLYSQMSDYTAALDNYLKDVSRPQNPFTFITGMLSVDSGLAESNVSSFREVVLSHLPQLIQLSTLSTLSVVLKHFSSENQRILRELSPHPELLFNYLKAVMNIRSIGQDYSQLELRKDAASTPLSTIGQSMDYNQSAPIEINNEGYSVLDAQVHLADLLQRSGLEFTDEMAETFVELLCRFEPKSVRIFLERYENYRLEHCLKLCQEYSITDAAAFLLERVGDVANALSLILADLHVYMQEMDQALALLVTTNSFKESIQGGRGDEFLDLTEVRAVHSVLRAAVALCQRNTFRLEPQESESLWFRLFDRFVEPLHNLNKKIKNSSTRRKVCTSDSASKLLRGVLVKFIGDIVNEMMGYVPLPVIMGKILEDHREHEFGDFKATILNMLSAYGYERAILGTAKQLIEVDTFQNVNAFKRGCTHAFIPTDPTCSVCGRHLDDPVCEGVKSRKMSTNTPNLEVDDGGECSSSDVVQQGIRIFPCGHASHLGCVEVYSVSAMGRSSGALVCPICSYKHKPVDLSWHSKDSSLLKCGVIGGGASKAKQKGLIDYSKQGSKHKADDHVFFGVSRLQLLKHLEEGTDLHNLGPSLKLDLAPALTQYKRDSLPSRNPTHMKGNKLSLETNSKGDSMLISQRKSKLRT